MRNWLQAKQEEDRRRQEEEKTRQEGLRLEQRRIEHSMLHESLQGGIPPHLIPMVFAGMGGGNLPAASLDWAQHYMAEWQQAQQQQQLHLQQQPPQHQQQMSQAVLPQPSQPSPELRRESRPIGQPQPNPYASQPPPPAMQAGPLLPGHPSMQQPPPQGATFLPPYQPGSISPITRPGRAPSVTAPSSAPRPQPHGVLPRLNTSEMQIQNPPTHGSVHGGVRGSNSGSAIHPLHQSHIANTSPPREPASQSQSQSSPNIYFHHWVPPSSGSTKEAREPTTPSGLLP